MTAQSPDPAAASAEPVPDRPPATAGAGLHPLAGPGRHTLGVLIDPDTSSIAVDRAVAMMGTVLIRRDAGVVLLPHRRAEAETLCRVVAALHGAGVVVDRVADLPSQPESELHRLAAACNRVLASLRPENRLPPAALARLSPVRLYRMLRAATGTLQAASPPEPPGLSVPPQDPWLSGPVSWGGTR